MSFRDTLLILLVVLIFGTNFVAMKYGLEEMPPMFFVALRFIFVLVPLIFILPPPNNRWYKILGVGLFINTLQFALLFIAMKADISAGLASLLIQMQVPLTLILSFLLLGERLTKIQLVGISIALSGFLFFFAEKGGNVTVLGIVLVFLSALSWSLGNLILKTSKKSNPLHLVVWSSLVPPIPLLILSYMTESQSPIAIISSMSLKAWLSVIYVAFLSSVIGYTIWSKMMAKYSAIQVTPFALLIPIVGMISGAVLLDEALTQLEQIGAFSVLLGLFFCVLGPKIHAKFLRSKAKKNN